MTSLSGIPKDYGSQAPRALVDLTTDQDRKQKFGRRVSIGSPLDYFKIKAIVYKPDTKENEAINEALKAKAVTIKTATGEKVEVNIKSLARRLNISVESIREAEKAGKLDKLIKNQLKIMSSPAVIAAFEEVGKSFATISRSPQGIQVGKKKEFLAVYNAEDKRVHLYKFKTRFGFFKKILGKGQMGTAYEVVSYTRPASEVLKVSQPDIPSLSRQQKLIRERDVLQIAHSRGQIPGVESTPYLTTYKGRIALLKPRYSGDLAGYNKKTHDMSEKVSIARQLLETRERLRAIGIVNPDIKPSNIFFKDGKAFIADWDGGMILNPELLRGWNVSAVSPVSVSPGFTTEHHYDEMSRLVSIYTQNEKLAQTTPSDSVRDQAFLAMQRARGELAILSNESMDLSVGITMFMTLTGLHPQTLTAEGPLPRRQGYPPFASLPSPEQRKKAMAHLEKIGCKDPEVLKTIETYLTPVKDRPAQADQKVAAERG